MARPVKVSIAGRGFTLYTEEQEDHVHRVAARVDSHVADIQAKAKVPLESAALLAGLKLADELSKAEAQHLDHLETVRSRAVAVRDRLIALAEG